MGDGTQWRSYDSPSPLPKGRGKTFRATVGQPKVSSISLRHSVWSKIAPTHVVGYGQGVNARFAAENSLPAGGARKCACGPARALVEYRRWRLWWNWQTRYFEVVVGQPVQVEVLLSAPVFLSKLRNRPMFAQHLHTIRLDLPISA